MSSNKPVRGQSPGRKASKSLSKEDAQHGATSQLAMMSAEEVAEWLKKHGHGVAAERFKANDVTGDILETLTDENLKVVGIASFGERKKLLLLIENAVRPNRGRRTEPYSDDHEGTRKPGQSPHRPLGSDGRLRPHRSKPADAGTLMGAFFIDVLVGLALGFATGGLGYVPMVLFSIVYWSQSCDSIGDIIVGIRYERLDGTGEAGIGLMAASSILQSIFFFFSVGICVFVDAYMVLSSATHQGITGRMFGIYPVEKSRSVFNARQQRGSRVDEADD
jgi:hypothetical protein